MAAHASEAGAERAERQAAASERLDPRRTWTTHGAEQLQDFILSDFEGREVDLRGALALLQQAYREACYQSKEKPLTLRFELEGASAELFSFHLRGQSLMACLRYLAAMGGVEIEGDGPDFVLKRHPEAETRGEGALLPGGEAAVAGLLAQLRRDAGLAEGAGGEDWEGVLRAAGLLRDAASSVRKEADGSLVLHGSRMEMARVSSALALAMEPKLQLKVAIRHVSTSEVLESARKPLGAEESADLLRKLQERPDTRMATLPSITMREGETATIEMIREKIRPAGEGQWDVGWVGVKEGVEAARTGLKIVARMDSERRAENEGDFSWQSHTNHAAGDGETWVERVASRDGTHEYRLITVTVIDATGRPVRGQFASDEVIVSEHSRETDRILNTPGAGGAYPQAAMVPGMEGMVFSPHNNRVVDVRGIPSGTLVMDPTYPPAERRFFRVP
jgi:hypothetical protein